MTRDWFYFVLFSVCVFGDCVGREREKEKTDSRRRRRVDERRGRE